MSRSTHGPERIEDLRDRATPRERSHATDENVNTENLFVMSTTNEVSLEHSAKPRNSRPWTTNDGVIHVKPAIPEATNDEGMNEELSLRGHVVSIGAGNCESQNSTNTAVKDEEAISVITGPQEKLDSSEDEIECRICQCRGDEMLVSPCHCDGSTKWVHETCLIKWFRISGLSSCELCSQNITVKKILKPMRQWRRPSVGIIGGPCLKVDIWYMFLTLFSIGTIIGFAAFQERVQSKDPQTVGVFALIYILCILMIIVRIRYFYQWFVNRSLYWQTWKTLNEEWTLTQKGSICEAVEVSVV